MNCEQAKRIDLVDFLARLGYQPAKTPRDGEYWYLSPLRDEKTPSFKVDRNRNYWIDFFDGASGSIIDLGIRLFQCSTQELLTKLSGSFNDLNVAPAAKPKPAPRAPKIIITSVHPITSPALVTYLQNRCIPLDVAHSYLSEVHFMLRDKSYYALGFKNQSGGYALRNAFFKAASKPNDVTLFRKDPDTLVIFEGFFNFLSFAAHQQAIGKPLPSALILNSLSFFERSMPLMDEFKHKRLYLDNDPAGRKFTERVCGETNKGSFQDCSMQYKNYKDYNDWWKLSWMANRCRKVSGHFQRAMPCYRGSEHSKGLIPSKRQRYQPGIRRRSLT